MTPNPDPSESAGEPMEPGSTQDQARGAPAEPVWTFRGYQLRPAEFNTAMVHFFRAEISRANVWRQRLDATTNWAVIATGAAISYAFSQPTGHHSVLLMNILLVTMFLFIEARRYRYYELWSSRIRLMETDFFAAMLVPPFHPSPEWAESLAESLLQPHFPISNWEALGRRFRRNYVWIYVILLLAWIFSLTMYPSAVVSIPQLADRAVIGYISGWLVISMLLIFYALLFGLGVLTIGLHEASGEVLPRYLWGGEEGDPSPRMQSRRWQPWFRHARRRRQLLAYVVSDRYQLVADRIMKEMRRGMTKLSGTGMYTGSEHGVLMCALTVTEVGQFRSLVSQEDPKAFVIVTPAQDIYGEGFSPLEVEQA